MNAWCTSYRFKEHVKLPCIFGCEGERDELAHYLRCDGMWRLVESATGEETKPDLLGRLGMHDPSRCSITQLASSFVMYHTLRNTHAHLLKKRMSIREFDHLLSLAFEICTVAWRDLSAGLPLAELPNKSLHMLAMANSRSVIPIPRPHRGAPNSRTQSMCKYLHRGTRMI